MPKFETILDAREQRIDDALEIFTSGFDKIEQNLFKSLDEVLKKTTVSFGKLSNDEYSRNLISRLDNVIRKSLEESGYGNKVNQLVGTYDFIGKDNIDLQKALNKKTVSQKLINSITTIEQQNTVERLLNSGLYKDFIAPVRTAMYRHTVLGTSLHDAEETIRKIIISDPSADSKILSYAKQVSQDAIYQFDGAVNQSIQEDLGLDALLYVGSITKDSRGQCRYWVGKKILKLDKKLEAEIATASSKGGALGGYKCSGMIPGTNLGNFIVNRGGFKCRHRGLPTLFENYS